MTYEERRLAHWILQTMRNMQALGFGHQSGEPYLMMNGGVLLTRSNTPFPHLNTEEWVTLNVQAHGEKIIGAGYVYGNLLPAGFREAPVKPSVKEAAE